jgi:hypothetical protein
LGIDDLPGAGMKRMLYELENWLIRVVRFLRGVL